MNSTIDFRTLYKKEETPAPDPAELFHALKKFRRTAIRKLVLANIALLLTSGLIITVWYIFEPKMITTKIGIVMVILAMLLYLLAYNKLFPLLLRVRPDTASSEYLQQLLKVKKQQQFLQTTMMTVYFVLLSAGICLYMYEYAVRMSVTGRWLCYGITLAWIAVNWFYFRPPLIKKQRQATDELIDKFERLQAQANEKNIGEI